MLMLLWVVLLARSVIGRAFENFEASTTSFEDNNDDAGTMEPAKLMEQYVIDADFDNRPVAQVQLTQGNEQESNSSQQLEGNKASRIVAEEEVSNAMTQAYFPPMLSNRPLTDYDQIPSAVDRDAIIPHGPGPLLVSQRSVLAVGFITFLILLSSLQNNVVNMVAATRPAPAPSSTSLLGGVTQALGRRR